MSRTPDTPVDAERVDAQPEDEGTILVMVLVMMVIGSLIILPLLVYTMSVFRAGSVQTDKSEAVELARGGTWVALANQENLYNMCDGRELSDALADVSTTCQIVEVNQLRPAAEIPYHVVTARSDVPVPGPIATADTININHTSVDPGGWDQWIDNPDWSSDSALNKVWLPELAVQATSTGVRETFMPPGTFDNPPFSSCDVFFPGTFNAAIDIDSPTYFTSGVYYFTEPITIRNGAHVVVGNGGAGGCTTDFEAVASANTVPTPLNMSGYGGTFVLGDNARIVIDDSGAGDIFFAMNQRYVSPDDTSALASANVSIISVNGTHAPLVGAEVLGDDLIVNDVIHVPASTVGNGDPVSPLAVASGYTPSNLTNKSYVPDAPTNVVANDYQRGGPGGDGLVVVTWDAPDDNGSPITGYTVTDSEYGHSCTPLPPTATDTSVQTSCVITGISHQSGSSPRLQLTVTATNAIGTSPPSANLTAPRVDLSGGGQSPELNPPDEPVNFAVPNVYSNGLEFSWDPPADDGGAPISGYRVTAKVPGPGGVVVDSCDAWWDETSCVLLGLTDSTMYHMDVVALQTEGPPYVEYQSPDAHLATGADLWVLFDAPGNDAPPDLPPVVSTFRIPDPIVDFTTTSANTVDLVVEGYVAVPQGRIEIGAASPAGKTVHMTGGLVAGDIWLDASAPADLQMFLDNPISQKRMKIHSVTSGKHISVSEAIVQVNKSGSIAINSWFSQ